MNCNNNAVHMELPAGPNKVSIGRQFEKFEKFEKLSLRSLRSLEKLVEKFGEVGGEVWRSLEKFGEVGGEV